MLCLKMMATGIGVQNSIKNNYKLALDNGNANITDPRRYINFPLLQNLQAEKKIFCKYWKHCSNHLDLFPETESKAFVQLSAIPLHSPTPPCPLFPDQDANQSFLFFFFHGRDRWCCLAGMAHRVTAFAWTACALHASTHLALHKHTTCYYPMHLRCSETTQWISKMHWICFSL